MKLNALLQAVVILLSLPQLVAASTLLVLGDSLSAAYGMRIEQGWVGLLQQRLADEQLGYRVVNASISGDTTASARARLPQAIARHQPSIVILEIGGNDGLRGLSLVEMKNNLAAMIETIRLSEAEVLLIGVDLPPNYGPGYTRRFRAVYQDLARRYGVALVPSLVEGVGTRPELMQADGIHPNSMAQPSIAARVWQQLDPLINGPPNPADGQPAGSLPLEQDHQRGGGGNRQGR